MSGWIKPIEAGEHDVEVEVEHARSGRSQCRACNTFIKQGELRLGIEVESASERGEEKCGGSTCQHPFFTFPLVQCLAVRRAKQPPRGAI